MLRILTITFIATALVLMQAAPVSGKDPSGMTVSLEDLPPQYHPKQPSSDSLEINWDVLSGGGRKTTTTGFILSGTVGQLAIGDGSAVDVNMHHGYWQDIGVVCVPGDANESGAVDIDDVVYLIMYIFQGGPAPTPMECCGDANGSGAIDIDDVVYLIMYIFQGGPEPDPTACTPPWLSD